MSAETSLTQPGPQDALALVH